MQSPRVSLASQLWRSPHLLQDIGHDLSVLRRDVLDDVFWRLEHLVALGTSILVCRLLPDQRRTKPADLPLERQAVLCAASSHSLFLVPLNKRPQFTLFAVQEQTDLGFERFHPALIGRLAALDLWLRCDGTLARSDMAYT